MRDETKEMGVMLVFRTYDPSAGSAATDVPSGAQKRLRIAAATNPESIAPKKIAKMHIVIAA